MALKSIKSLWKVIKIIFKRLTKPKLKSKTTVNIKGDKNKVNIK